MGFQEQQLFQSRPSGTTAASVYSPGSGETARILSIKVCNTSGATAKFRIFCDDDGTTYDETTALYWDITVPADDTWELQKHDEIMMNNSAGNLAFRTDTANALTVTGFGVVIS